MWQDQEMGIDVSRCRRAMENVFVYGPPTTDERFKLIEEAISSIINSRNTMTQKRFCIKNYAAFGDQREDHKYGYGPKHGSIVFSIERTRNKINTCLGEDEICLLECVRDFGYVEGYRDSLVTKNLICVM